MLLLSEFCLHRFRLQVLLPMDTHTSSRRALKLAQEQEVAEDRRQPRHEGQSSTCCRDFRTKERESEGREVMLATLLKLLVKDKLLHSEKVPVNVEVTRNRSSAIRHFEWGDEDVDGITFNFYTGPPHIYFSIHLFIPVLKKDRI